MQKRKKELQECAVLFLMKAPFYTLIFIINGHFVYIMSINCIEFVKYICDNNGIVINLTYGKERFLQKWQTDLS